MTEQRLPVFSSQNKPPASSSLAWQVVHHLPGRLRLRIPTLRFAGEWDLRSSLEQTVGIRSVRINRAACSLAICYRPEIEPTLQELLVNLEAHCWQQQPLPSESLFEGSLESSASQISQQTSPTEAGQWSGLKLPLLTTGFALASRLSWLPGMRTATVLTLLAATFPVGRRAVESLVIRRKFNIDCLDLLALSLGACQGKLLTPALVLTLHELGDAIREQTARTTAVQAAKLEDAIGHFAWIKETPDSPPHQIASDRVQMGQTVVVYPGEQIPVDGVVIKGDAIIDQQSLTGEAMPVVGQIGTQVYASTLLRSGQLFIRAERVGCNTRAAAGLELLRQAPVYDTRMANYAQQVADRLILPSLLLAGIVLLTTHDTARTASILTLDFVTGIRVSIPMAFLSALNHTTRHGVLIRSGRTLEQLANVDTIVFDKTGTLTQGQITVVDIQPVAASVTKSDILQLAASAEQRLNHPVAEAITQYANTQNVLLLTREHWTYEVGLGIRAHIEGREVLVGSERFLQQSRIRWTDGFTSSRTEIETDSLIYIACDGQFQGTIRYSDPLRSESADLVQRLQKEYGIDLYLLTGDNPRRASQVTKQLGLSNQHVYAEAFPEQKAQIVRDLHKSGHTVAFVGDGLNDSIALAYADVSVSFARGAEVARETADVVLMNNNLLDFLEVIAIARQTRALIDQNIGLVVLPNLAALGVATTRGLSPLMATGIHNGSAIIAGLNSLRPLLQHQLNPQRMAS
ncbi:MAG: heavy metal translocating P-type ATPase [Cyanobacteria bacterium P01_B01_bin.77]